MSTPPRETASASKDFSASTASGYSIATALLVSLGIYFGLHVLTRSLVSHNLQLDEAEQFVVTQQWRLGYGSQPPLYDWMQKALFGILGMNVFALSLLKNVTLYAAYAFTFLAAREILPTARLAALATAGMFFIPQIAWESQRDQSHLVLATALAAGTLWIYMRLLKSGQPGWYIAFGTAIALGFLSKYNYIVLPVGLISASLVTPQYRRSVLSPKILLSAAAFAIITAPHLIWMLENKAAVSSQSYKFLATGYIAGKWPLAGPPQFAKAILGMAIVPTLVFMPLLMRRYRTKSDETPALVRLLGKTFIAAIVLSLIVIVATRVTFLRDRWVQPLMFALPILLAGLTHQQIEERHFKRLFSLAIVVAIFVLTAINGTVIGANALGRSHNLNIPYPALAMELRKMGFDHGTIIANGFALGGNLKNQFRNCRVMVPELAEKEPPERPTLLIWSARTSEMPADFLEYASGVTGAKIASNPTYLDIPCQNGNRTSEKFGLILLP